MEVLIGAAVYALAMCWLIHTFATAPLREDLARVDRELEGRGL